MTDQTAKIILYAFKKDNLDGVVWEEKTLRYINESEKRSVHRLLEDFAEIDAFKTNEPNVLTVGLVLQPDHRNRERQLAIRYQLEKPELTDSDEQIPEGTEREVGYAAEYQIAVCRDYKQLFWDGLSLVEE